MTNETMVLVFSLLAVITGIVIIISIIQGGMRNLGASFWVMGACVFLALLSDVVYFGVPVPALVMFFYNFKIPFEAFAALAIFILAMRFYRQDKVLTPKFKLALSIIPIIVTILSLTSTYHPLLRFSQRLASMHPIRIMEQMRGVGYWVHGAYCYVLLIAAIVVAFAKHYKLPAGYRAPSTVFIISLFICAASTSIHIFTAVPFDGTLIGMAIAYVILYVAIGTSARADLLVIARDEIFNYLEELVFILSPARQMLDANIAARKWMRSLGIEPEFPFPFARVMEVLHDKGVSIHRGGNAEDGIDLHFSGRAYNVMYNLKERFVLDEENHPIGFYITMFDVTRYKNTIDRLEVMAEIDALTGLPNRRAYESLKTRYSDVPPPFSIIMGDVNNLKVINDDHGHQLGDQLLQIVANQLRRSCPEHGTVMRIGGDEFIMFLPDTTSQEAQRVMFAVDQSLRNKRSYVFAPSIALGLATKEREEDTLDEIIRLADTDMYDNKNDRRTGRAITLSSTGTLD